MVRLKVVLAATAVRLGVVTMLVGVAMMEVVQEAEAESRQVGVARESKRTDGRGWSIAQTPANKKIHSDTCLSFIHGLLSNKYVCV